MSTWCMPCQQPHSCDSIEYTVHRILTSLPYLVLAHRFLIIFLDFITFRRIISLDFINFHQFISLDYFFLCQRTPHYLRNLRLGTEKDRARTHAPLHRRDTGMPRSHHVAPFLQGGYAQSARHGRRLPAGVCPHRVTHFWCRSHSFVSSYPRHV